MARGYSISQDLVAVLHFEGDILHHHHHIHAGHDWDDHTGKLVGAVTSNAPIMLHSLDEL